MSICVILNIFVVYLIEKLYICLEIEGVKSRNGFTSRYHFDKNEVDTDWLMQN